MSFIWASTNTAALSYQQIRHCHLSLVSSSTWTLSLAGRSSNVSATHFHLSRISYWCQIPCPNSVKNRAARTWKRQRLESRRIQPEDQTFRISRRWTSARIQSVVGKHLTNCASCHSLLMSGWLASPVLRSVADESVIILTKRCCFCFCPFVCISVVLSVGVLWKSCVNFCNFLCKLWNTLDL